MVGVFLAEGFEEIEAISVIDILRRAEIEVITVAVGDNILVNGAHNIKIKADLMENSLEVSKLDAIVLPGGMPGTLNLEKSEIVKKCIMHCIDNNKYIGAICAAPSILGHLRLLNGKRATCYPGFERDLGQAEVCSDLVCVDGNIVTGKGPGAATEFALKVLELILGHENSHQVRMGLQCV